jgi:predicted metal-binding transcription factor (methanogenesis marker protein 9)
LDTDTVVAITPQQLIEINLSRNDYMQLKELHTQLQKYVVASDSTIYYWERVAATKDTEIQLERQKFEEAEKINKSITEAFESQKKKSKRTVIGVGVGGTLVGILLGVLLK